MGMNGFGRWTAIVPLVRCAVLGAGIFLLVSCGGGDGTVAGPPANRAPIFTSNGATSFPERSLAVVYKATATDPEGSPVTFTISGGADATKFVLANDDLSFSVTPDFEVPGDANGDNVYEVQLSASDGQATTTLALKITLTDASESLKVKRIATGLVDPVALSPFSDTLVLAAEASGAIYEINPTTRTRKLIGKVDNLVPNGLISMTASNTYHIDGGLFVMYHSSDGNLVVEGFDRKSGTFARGNMGSILKFATSERPGGWLGWINGALYVGIGDPTGSAQDAASRFGKIYRATLMDDPYAGASIPLSAYNLTLVAKGLHRPVYAEFAIGGLLIADRGKDQADEIDLLDFSKGIGNFGWPAKEGAIVVAGPVPADAIDPILSYPRITSGSVGLGIVGGVALGAASSLDGYYVFGDRGGAIFSTSIPNMYKNVPQPLEIFTRMDQDFTPDSGRIDHPVVMTKGQAFFLYILDEDGEVFVTN